MEDREVARRLDALDAAIDEAQALGVAACACLATISDVAAARGEEVDQRLQDLVVGLDRSAVGAARARQLVADLRAGARAAARIASKEE